MSNNSNSNPVHNNPPSRIVYLGSIPYDQTEQQILDLCSNIGPVVNLRMMFDTQTGKSKGYAFIEFKDLSASASAVRNLNGYQFGSRFLRCGYASNSEMSMSSGSNSGNTNLSDSNGGNNQLRFAGLPSGIDVNINMTTPAMMISSEVSKLSKTEQLSLLRNFQDWARDNPKLCKILFSEYPQLTYVIAELLLTNGISKVDDLTRLAPSHTGGGTSHQSDTSGSGVGSQQQLEENNRLSNDPKVRQKQRELLAQVLQLNDSQISVLPDDQKMTLWDLKQRAMKGEFGPLL